MIGLAGIFIFSLTLPVTKIAVESFNPYFVAFGRAAVAGLAAAFYLFATKASLPSKAEFSKLVIISLGVVFGFPVFTTVAMTYGASSHGAVILGLLPLVSTIFGVIRFKERPSLGFWIVSLIGGSIVVAYAFIQGSGRLTYFDGLLALGGVCAAIGYVEGGQLSKTMNPIAVISWALVISLPINLFVTFHLFDLLYLEASGKAWLCFSYLSLFSMYAGFFFWYRGLAMGGVSRVSQVLLLQPFFTLIAASILLLDPLNLMNLVFAGLVVVCVMDGKKMVVR